MSANIYCDMCCGWAEFNLSTEDNRHQITFSFHILVIYQPCVSWHTLTHCLPPGKHWSAVSLLGAKHENYLVKNQTDLWLWTLTQHSVFTSDSDCYFSLCSLFKQEIHQIKMSLCSSNYSSHWYLGWPVLTCWTHRSIFVAPLLAKTAS